jgi:hypothetical protein
MNTPLQESHEFLRKSSEDIEECYNSIQNVMESNGKRFNGNGTPKLAIPANGKKDDVEALAKEAEAKDCLIEKLKRNLVGSEKDKRKLEKKCEDRKVSLKKLYHIVVDKEKHLKKACDALEKMQELLSQFDSRIEASMMAKTEALDLLYDRVRSVKGKLCTFKNFFMNFNGNLNINNMKALKPAPDENPQAQSAQRQPQAVSSQDPDNLRTWLEKSDQKKTFRPQKSQTQKLPDPNDDSLEYSASKREYLTKRFQPSPTTSNINISDPTRDSNLRIDDASLSNYLHHLYTHDPTTKDFIDNKDQILQTWHQ